MIKRFRHIVWLILLLSGAVQALAQVGLPDKVCVGTTRHYWVVGFTGSVYTWKINGVAQASANDYLDYTWTTVGTFTLEVQEHQPICEGELQTGEVVVVDSPELEDLLPLDACDSYVFPKIKGVNLTGNEAYYNNSHDQGGVKILGPIYASQTLWVYDETGTDPNCFDETSFYVTIHHTPEITNPGPIVICDGYTLPKIQGVYLSGNEAYYDNSQALGGKEITSTVARSQTVWIYDPGTLAGCSAETSFYVKINYTPEITNPGLVLACDFYELPPIEGTNLTKYAAYYNNDPAKGGDILTGKITEDQTVWIFDETDTSPNCFDKISFTINIYSTPDIETPEDVTVCDSYVLPEINGANLSGNEAYYDNSQALGGKMIIGPITSPQTVWIYDPGVLAGCSYETSFKVNVELTPEIKNPGPITACDFYELPEIEGNNISGIAAYYTNNPAKGGDILTGKITESRTVWIFDETDSYPNCSDIDSFKVTITPSPDITNPGEIVACGYYELPEVEGKNLTQQAAYYNNDPALGGTVISGQITKSQTVWIYDQTNTVPSCSDIESFSVTINPMPTLKINNPEAVCEPNTVDLTASALTQGSDLNLIFTYWSDIDATKSLDGQTEIGTSGIYYIKATNPDGCSVVEPVTVAVDEQLAPTFAFARELCPDKAFPALPLVSENGIEGTWDPSAIYTNIGKNTYTFTPNTGQCAKELAVEIEVTNQATPSFSFDKIYCLNSIPPELPAVSDNDITGTWLPEAISTKSVGSTAYTFTPDAGQCGKSTTIYIQIIEVVPSFSMTTTLCQKSVAPKLPLVSDNNISGYWVPANLSTDSVGSFVYSFKAYDGQCAGSVSKVFTVYEKSIPLFDPIGPLCLKSVPPVLPTTSKNGITGAWDPSVISTSTPDKVTYQFVPDDSWCTAGASMVIEVLDKIEVNIKADPLLVPGGTTKVTVSATGGSGTYSSGTGIFYRNAGTYSFTVVDDAGCTATGTITIENPSDLVVTATITNPIKCEGGFARVEVKVTGAKKPVVYSYTGGNPSYSSVNDSVFLVRASGIPYVFNVKDADNKYGEAAPLLIQNPLALTLAITFTQPTCSGGADGTATVTATNGAGSYTYQWDDPLKQKTAKAVGLKAGAYVVEVNDDCDVPQTATAVIPETPEMTLAAVGFDSPCSGTIGSILFTFTNVPNGKYDILYDGGELTDVQVKDNEALVSVPLGNYNNLRISIKGCATPNGVNVTINSIPKITVSESIIQPTCYIPTGTIVVTIPQQGSGFQYSLDGGAYQDSAKFANLSPGEYHLMVKGVGSDCESDVKTITIKPLPDPPSAPVASVSIQPNCIVQTGTITVSSPSVGSGFTYSIDEGLKYVATNKFIGLSPGATYRVIVKDIATGCVSEATSLTIDPVPDPPSAPTAMVTVLPTCKSPTGTIEVTSPAKGSGFTYSADGVNFVASPILEGLAPKTYSITIKDITTGCISPATLVTIDPISGIPDAPIASVTYQPTCYVTTGTIEISNPVLGSGFVYSIDGGKTYVATNQFTGLSPDTYALTVKEIESECVSTATTLIVDQVPDPPVAPTASVTFQPNCIVTTGTIVITSPAEGSGFEYSVDGGANYLPTATFDGLDPNPYTLVVRDIATGCVSPELNLTVDPIPPNPAAPVASVTQQPTCIVTTGTIELTTPLGSNFTYSIDGENYQASPIFTDLVPGNYSIRVKETDTGCETIAETTLAVNPIPDPPAALVASVTVQPSCIVSTGTIEITEPLGAIYSYSIDGKPYQSEPVFTGLLPGSYSLSVKDIATGCETMAEQTLVVNPIPATPTAPVASVAIQPTCIVPTGTIEVSAPLGTIYEYSLNDTTYQTSPVFASLAPGNYTVSVKETATGCETKSTKVLVVDPVPLPPNAPTASVTVQPNCGAVTGTIKVSAPLGTAYEYSVDGTSYQSSPIFENLDPGIYSVTVKVKANECVSDTTSLTVDPVPSIPLAPVSTGDLTICQTIPATTLNAMDAIIIESGITISMYDKSIGGVKIAAPTLSAIGTITYYAEAFNGVCSSLSRTAIVLTINPVPATPVAKVTVSPTCDNPDGTFVITQPLGEDYEYSLNDGVYQASAVFDSLSTNRYIMKVRNILTGCVSDTSGIGVPAIPPSPVLEVTSIENCKCYNGNGSISFNITNAIDGIYTIKYDGGEFSNVSIIGGKAKVEVPEGSYNNMTIEVNTCISLEVVSVTITQPDQIVIDETVTEIDLKSQTKGSIDLQVSGGTGTYSYKWSTGETTVGIKDLVEGSYTVWVTDSMGCVVEKLITIPQPNYPPVAVDDTFTSMCSYFTGELLSNDYDPENDPFFIDVSPIILPLHGTVNLNSDGTFEYTADSRFEGVDSLQYAIYDVNHYQGDTATVTINIFLDSDHDGIADSEDPDADGDGILNIYEGGNSQDADGDGFPNYLDIDSDNDGIVDNIEAQSTAGYIPPSFKDENSNGVDDAYDVSQGGTLITPVDTDGDGITDFLDSDSDNDGVPDYIEGHDYNGDGKPDVFAAGKDSDSDGLDDAYDTFEDICASSSNSTASNASIQDFEGDGIRDWRDDNDDDDSYPTKSEDLNADGDFSNDDIDFDGHPEYLDYGRDCELFIPNAFSPNGDNIHDYFQIYCIDAYPNAKMYIFDQLGNKLFEKANYGNLDVWKTHAMAWWDGKPQIGSSNNRNEMVSPGTYYYVLNLGNGDVRKSFVFISY